MWYTQVKLSENAKPLDLDTAWNFISCALEPRNYLFITATGWHWGACLMCDLAHMFVEDQMGSSGGFAISDKST